MGLLILVGGLVLAAIVALVFVLWSRGRQTEAPSEPVHPARRKSDSLPVPSQRRPAAPGDLSSEDLSDAVHRQRQKAGRLVAGHVHLLDMHALLEQAPKDSSLTPAKALQIAETVTRKMVRPSDTVIVMKPDGIAILFDGASREEAETRSRGIADKVTEALGHVGGGDQFMAEGFGYELEAVLEGATIDTIDDLIRFVRIAHQGYVQKQRGIAKQFASEIEIRWEPILDSRSGAMFGFEIRVFKRSKDGAAFEDASFLDMDGASGSEFDCVVIEKLAQLGPKITGGQDDLRILLPLRTEGLINPLYFANVAESLEKLGSRILRQMVPVLSTPSPRARRGLAGVVLAVKRKLPAVGMRVGDPQTDLIGLAGSGITIAVMDRVEARFKDPGRAIDAFSELAKAETLIPVALGVGESLKTVKHPIAYSGDT
ncbi:MAG: hypothetical protein NXI19_07665 [Alphaproteobacteria bacterium]|nr:hypothetical protein [Alphaproteobacteria bacterium]